MDDTGCLTRFGINQRDHTKILVVDGRLGFTGGINIGDEYAPLEDGGGGWYDMQARAAGSVGMLVSGDVHGLFHSLIC